MAATNQKREKKIGFIALVLHDAPKSEQNGWKKMFSLQKNGGKILFLFFCLRLFLLDVLRGLGQAFHLEALGGLEERGQLKFLAAM
jgi:hypothetical protein